MMGLHPTKLRRWNGFSPPIRMPAGSILRGLSR